MPGPERALHARTHHTPVLLEPCLGHLAVQSGRTFVEPHALPDMLASLAGDGLCTLDGNGESQRATGTARGEARVAHLLSMSRSIEKTALAGTDDHERATLDRLLKQMVANTDS